MKRLFCLLLGVWSLVSAQTAGTTGCMEKQLNETLDYSMQLHGLPAARAQLSCERTAGITLSAAINTNALTGLVFKIHNYYTTTLDEQGRLREYSKQIDQHNITQSLRITYDHPRMLATTDDNRQWTVSPGVLNLFALLYRLRYTDWRAEQLLSIDLDIESQPWHALCASREVSNRVIAGVAAERMIEISFTAAAAITPRAWKTDLLTNRITRGGKLYVLLGPAPDHLPLFLQFGEGSNRVEMKLTGRKGE